MWSFTDPIWESIFKWATVAAAIFGAISITSAFVSAWVGYQITDATQKEADTKIAQARAETEKANLGIARANVAIAEAQKDAEEARAEQARLKQALSWRTFSVDAFNRLVSGLNGPKGKIRLAYQTGEPDVGIVGYPGRPE